MIFSTPSEFSNKHEEKEYNLLSLRLHEAGNDKKTSTEDAPVALTIMQGCATAEAECDESDRRDMRHGCL